MVVSPKLKVHCCGIQDLSYFYSYYHHRFCRHCHHHYHYCHYYYYLQTSLSSMILFSSSMTALCTNACLKEIFICCRKNLIRVILGDPVLTYWEFTGNVFANNVSMKNGTTQDYYSYRISHRSILCPVQTS